MLSIRMCEDNAIPIEVYMDSEILYIRSEYSRHHLYYIIYGYVVDEMKYEQSEQSYRYKDIEVVCCMLIALATVGIKVELC